MGDLGRSEKEEEGQECGLVRNTNLVDSVLFYGRIEQLFNIRSNWWRGRSLTQVSLGVPSSKRVHQLSPEQRR